MHGVIMVSNLPSSVLDIKADPKIHVFDSRVKVGNAESPAEIAAKCLKTYVLEFPDDETDEQVVEWSDQPVNPSL